jgi:hypothetical protein
LGIGLTACGDALSPESVLGVWALESLNGDPVPGVVSFNSGAQYEFEYERYTIRANGGCGWQARGRQVGSDTRETLSTPNCEYTLDPAAGTLTTEIYGTAYEFSVSGTEMRIVSWGRPGRPLTAFPDAMVYRRK